MHKDSEDLRVLKIKVLKDQALKNLKTKDFSNKWWSYKDKSLNEQVLKTEDLRSNHHVSNSCFTHLLSEASEVWKTMLPLARKVHSTKMLYPTTSPLILNCGKRANVAVLFYPWVTLFFNSQMLSNGSIFEGYIRRSNGLIPVDETDEAETLITLW